MLAHWIQARRKVGPTRNVGGPLPPKHVMPPALNDVKLQREQAPFVATSSLCLRQLHFQRSLSMFALPLLVSADMRRGV